MCTKMYSLEVITIIEDLGLTLLLLIRVMYITQLERKLMGRIQRRIGPLEILQSLSDGFKLMIKGRVSLKQIDEMIYNVIIILSFILNV